LEIKDSTNQTNVEDRYIPLPKEIDWNQLELIFSQVSRQSFDAFTTTTLISKHSFLETFPKFFNVNIQDSNLQYLSELIFGKENGLKDRTLVRRIWNSLQNLYHQRKNIDNIKACYFTPLNKALPEFECLHIKDELIKNPDLLRNYVMASYIKWPACSDKPWVKIESTVGIIGDPRDDVRVILANNKVKTDQFSGKVMNQEKEIIQSWNDNINKLSELTERSEERIFSIDGSSTRIRDDAFSIQKLSGEDKGCYKVGIHIADVTRVIKEDSDIFKEAEERFQSCYIGKNFYKSMLPNKLQNYLSLQKGEWRYAFSIYIIINEEGIIDPEKIILKHTLIKLTENLTYNQVDDLFKDLKLNCNEDVKNDLFLLRNLALKLNERREKLGFKFDLNDEEDSGNTEKDSHAHMMVEEFMLLANEIITDYVKCQRDSLASKMVKIRNEEKRLAKAEIQRKQEEKKAGKTQKKKKTIKRKIKKTEVLEDGSVVKVEEEIEDVEDEPEAHINNEEKEKDAEENEDEECKQDSEEDLISENEEVKTNEKVLVDEDESDSDDSFSLNINKIEEASAIQACKFLQMMWEIVDDRKKLDLTDQKKYAESVNSMIEDESIKKSKRSYIKYLLRSNNRKIRLVLNKKLKLNDDELDSKEKILSLATTLDEEEKSDFYNESNLEADDKQEVIEISEPNHEESKLQENKKIVTIASEVKNDDMIANKCQANKEKQKKQAMEVVIPTALKVENIKKEKKPSEEHPAEKEIINEKTVITQIETERPGFSLEYSENIIKQYGKLKDSQKLKFTSPIRRFYDILVHLLVDDILKLEEKILRIDNIIQEKLLEQENNQEQCRQKKLKKKKMKTRYQIFKELDSQLQGKIKGIATAQKRIKEYYEKNSATGGGGLNRAEREIEIMETCKSVISENEGKITKGLVVRLQKSGKINVYLLDYSIEYILVNKCHTLDGKYGSIILPGNRKEDIQLFDDIEVEINVKKTFPLDFQLKFHKNLSKTEESKRKEF